LMACVHICTSNFRKIWKPPNAVFETKLCFLFWFVVLGMQKTHKQILNFLLVSKPLDHISIFSIFNI
jgi:hypothetical protein